MLNWFEAVAPIRQKFRVLFWLTGALSSVGFVTTLLAGGDIMLSSIAFAAFALTLITMAIATDRVCRPYVNTVLRMEALAAGDTNSVIVYTDYRDCVGRMTKAMESFRDNAIEVDRNREVLAKIISSLKTGVHELQENRFDYQIEDSFGPENDSLRLEFNDALKSLSALVNSIRETASNVQSGAMEIRAASDDLSQRNEKQANVIEETSSAMNDVTSGIRENASSAAEIQRTIANTLREVTQGEEVVRKATEAMGNIEKSSNEITQIISVIDGIAFQTNLLALNAGVEAARAGDAGKGFAVVANEVRALAQRSGDAARDIKDLITASSAQVSGGVTLVNETGTLLQTILEQVGEANSRISAMAQSASEQSSTLDNVNTAVNSMDGVTRQNAAMVEQTTAAIHQMAEEVNALTKMLSTIKTINQSGGSSSSLNSWAASSDSYKTEAAAPVANSALASPVAPASPPAIKAEPKITRSVVEAFPKTAAPIPAPPPAPLRQAAAASSGNLALQSSSFDDDDWSEF